MTWRIYYGDGRARDGTDGLHAIEAPGRNIQVILQPNDRAGVEVLEGKDFYVRRNGEWIGLDLIGMVDFFVENGLLKVGQTLSHPEYQAVLDKALKDYDRRKSAWLASERHP